MIEKLRAILRKRSLSIQKINGNITTVLLTFKIRFLDLFLFIIIMISLCIYLNDILIELQINENLN